MVTLEAFSKSLREYVGPRGRPFVCEGSPIPSQVFLVGANPATEMSRPFWDFWDDAIGFDKARWFDQYLIDRANATLKPGKTRRNPVSNTRQRLAWIVEAAHPVDCLETNVYSEATETIGELGAEQRVTRIFEFLFTTIRPQLLVLHGKDARECVEALSGYPLVEGELSKQTLLGCEVKLLAVPHLSRGWSQKASRELGVRIREIVDVPSS